MHLIEAAHFLLDVALVHILGCVDDLGSRGWWLKLALLGLVVVVVVLVVVPDLVVDVGHGIGEGVKVLLGVLLAHEGVVLLFLEADFDRDPAAVEVGLAVEVLDGEEGAFLALVVDEGPVLRVFQPRG